MPSEFPVDTPRAASSFCRFFEIADYPVGANKTFQQKGDRGRLLGESDEFKRLRRAIDKAHGDRERAIAFVCRLYNVRTLDALPSAIRGAVHALLNE
jgi:hypothetical protein